MSSDDFPRATIPGLAKPSRWFNPFPHPRGYSEGDLPMDGFQVGLWCDQCNTIIDAQHDCLVPRGGATDDEYYENVAASRHRWGVMR